MHFALQLDGKPFHCQVISFFFLFQPLNFKKLTTILHGYPQMQLKKCWGVEFVCYPLNSSSGFYHRLKFGCQLFSQEATCT